MREQNTTIRFFGQLIFTAAFLAVLALPLLEFIRSPSTVFRLAQYWKDRDELNMALAEHSRFLQTLDEALAKIRFHKLNITPNRSFYLGKDGWFVRREARLREASGDAVVADAIIDQLGQDPFSEAEIADALGVLEARHTYLAQRGIQYVFAIVPRKGSIYGDHIYPRRIRKAFGETRLDQLTPVLEAHPFLNFVDLRAALLEARFTDPHSTPLYFKSDGHWNMLGAFHGYRAITNSIQAIFPDRTIEPLDFSHFKIFKEQNWCHDGFRRLTGICAREPFPVFAPKINSPLYSVPVIHDLARSTRAVKQPGRPEWTAAAPHSLLLSQGVGRTPVPVVTFHDASGTALQYRYLENYGDPAFQTVALLTASFGAKMVYFFAAHTERLFRTRETTSFDVAHLLNLDEENLGSLELVIQVFPEGVITGANKLLNPGYVR